MKNQKIIIAVAIIIGLAFAAGPVLNFIKSLKSDNNTTDNNPQVTVPDVVVNAPAFNSDTAYNYVKAQIDFGPRNPNSEGHKKCGEWIVKTAKQYADTVYVQDFEVKGFDGTMLKGKNIVASFNPTAKKRVLLLTHWDTRPWADRDTKDLDKPILGANDAASGVGVLLDVARALKSQALKNVGVDILIEDMEDYGHSEIAQGLVKKVDYEEDSYCLGTQHWAKNPHVPGYRADFGILLDMVGAPNAVFTREQTSGYYAQWVQDKVWANAHKLGYSSIFSNDVTAGVTDDHLYVNQILNIPTIDILQHDFSTPSGFGKYWHTHDDNLEAIDKNTLGAVGSTVLYTVYQFEAENAAAKQ
jgi:glutaminyl-peptide cyclotransferase